MFAQQPRSAPAPFYEKVKQAISEKIHSGVWRPHDRIRRKLSWWPSSASAG